MSEKPRNADMRGFQWRLAALERKLDHDLGLARSALAMLQREATDLDAVRHEMADAQAAQMRRAAELMVRRLDPGAHAACLQYLVLAENRLLLRRSEAEQLAGRVADARKACLDADRKLASLGSLRREDEAGYATQQSRRNARHADLVWMANAAVSARTAARRNGDSS